MNTIFGRVGLAISGAMALAACNGGGGGGGGTTGAPNSGTVTIGQYVVSGTTSSSQSAAFLALPLDVLETGAINGCSMETAGSCASVTCSGASLTGLSAGDVTVAVNGTALPTLVRSTSGFYSGTATGAIFSPGQTVSVTATGGDVPAFALSTTAPAAPAVTLPTSLTRNADAVIHWDGAVDADFVVVSISGTPASGSGAVIVSCRDLAPATGSVQVPAALLADLTGASAYVGIAGYRKVVTTAGRYDVALQIANGTAGAIALQ